MLSKELDNVELFSGISAVSNAFRALDSRSCKTLPYQDVLLAIVSAADVVWALGDLYMFIAGSAGYNSLPGCMQPCIPTAVTTSLSLSPYAQGPVRHPERMRAGHLICHRLFRGNIICTPTETERPTLGRVALLKLYVDVG